jgi:DNA-binding beta-propeller fold protein YncE
MRSTFLLAALGAALAACSGGEGDTAPVTAEACPETPGTICTFVGTGTAGYNGEGMYRTEAMTYFPFDIEFSPYGPPIVVDWNNHRLRRIEDDGTLTTVMGTDFIGDGPVDLSDMTPEGSAGTMVNLNHPTDVIYYPDGVLLLASWHTHKLRSMQNDANTTTHVVLGAGAGFAPGEDEAPSADVLLNQPSHIELLDNGDVAVCDMRNERIRIWTADDTVYTLAGNGDKGYGGDGASGLDVTFSFPKSENPEPGGALALGKDGWLYIADTDNHIIRRADLQTGLVELFAGVPETEGFAEGDRLSAKFAFPRDMEFTEDGNTLLIADDKNNRIRGIDMTTGEVYTIAGNGEAGFSGDGGGPLDAQLQRPFGVEIDDAGNLYIADTHNHRVRVVYGWQQ